jgi:hypothetical protein
MLWTPYHRPEPSREVEERYRAELKQIDALLDIKWLPIVWWNPKQQSHEGRYAVVVYWPGNDPRREMFQKGEVESDYDILCFVSKDIDSAEVPADPSEVWPRVLQRLANADNTRESWKIRMKRAAEKNLQLREKRKQDFLEGVVHDNASHFRAQNLGNAIVNVPAQIGEKKE